MGSNLRLFGQPSSVDSKGFISKLFHMLDNPQLYSDVISWE